MIDMLSETGLPVVEATSFVSPKWVPQVRRVAGVAGAGAEAALSLAPFALSADGRPQGNHDANQAPGRCFLPCLDSKHERL